MIADDRRDGVFDLGAIIPPSPPPFVYVLERFERFESMVALEGKIKRNWLVEG